MRKSVKKPVKSFDKMTSKAKEVVDEAAEESEDEFAGLGGASDDSAGEEDDIDRDMINDNSGEVVDENRLAAFYAYAIVLNG
jgi:mediator of replication checkpoint protein 1